MINTKVAIVVLHYQAIEDTIKCIQSIEDRIGIEEYQIVVVDNASPDHSGQILKNKYADNPKVKVILGKENLGFAKGNNIGYIWAKQNLNPRFIILSNNDVTLKTNDFYQEIEKEYCNSRFGVLGPLILNADGRYDTNPICLEKISKDTIIKQIRDARFHRMLNKIGLLNAYNTASVLKHVLKKEKRHTTKSIDYHEGCTLHGAFLILSPEFIDNSDGLNPNTYMYKEEYILHAETEARGLKMVYSPSLIVFHKEDASTDTIVKKSKDKWEFIYSNIIRSSQVLLEIYNKLDL